MIYVTTVRSSFMQTLRNQVKIKRGQLAYETKITLFLSQTAFKIWMRRLNEAFAVCKQLACIRLFCLTILKSQVSLWLSHFVTLVRLIKYHNPFILTILVFNKIRITANMALRSTESRGILCNASL